MGRRPFPPPSAFGAPARYTTWRPQQLSAVFQVSDSERRFRGLTAPTGMGKTLLAYLLIAMHGERGLVLTENLGLMDQYRDDLEGAGCSVALLKGAGNYPCPALLPGGQYSHLTNPRRGTNCDAGPCHSGLPCRLRSGGCPYYDAERRASTADVVVSNYSKRAVTPAEDDPLGSFGWLICDEFDAAPEAVGKALHVDLEVERAAELLDVGVPDVRRGTVHDWADWGRFVASRCVSRLTRLRSDLKLSRDTGAAVGRYELDQLTGLQRLQQTAGKLARLATGDWIITRPKPYVVSFDVMWPRTYAPELLFRDVPHVVGMSATARPKVYDYLGVSADDYDWFEQPSPFPVADRPVYVIPYAYVQWNMNQESIRRWLHGIDTLIEKHGAGRRVLVDTISYDRQDLVLSHSRNVDRMMYARRTERGKRNTAEVFGRFIDKNSPRDAVLVGPQFTRGYNLPGRACELAIATKLMFPDLRDPVLAARCKSDPEHRPYLTMQRLQQFAGRLVRYLGDRGLTAIIDGHAVRFLEDPANRKFAARYFLDALKIVRNGYLPKPLPPLSDEEVLAVSQPAYEDLEADGLEPDLSLT